MPVEEIKKFQEKTSQKKEMREDLVKIGNDVAKIVAYANKNGFTFTQQELQAAIDEEKANQTDGALNEEDLEKVAGGAIISIDWPPIIR
jgi:predicted ribosomally synthesized peptide with nif11-like leader